MLVEEVELSVYVLPLILQLHLDLAFELLCSRYVLSRHCAECQQVSHLRGSTVNPTCIPLLYEVGTMLHENVKLVFLWVIRLSLIRIQGLLVIFASIVHNERAVQGVVNSSVETILANETSLPCIEYGRVDVLHSELLLCAVAIDDAALRSLDPLCNSKALLIDYSIIPLVSLLPHRGGNIDQAVGLED